MFFFFCYNRQIEGYTPNIHLYLFPVYYFFFFKNLQNELNQIRNQKEGNKQNEVITSCPYSGTDTGKYNAYGQTL